MEILQEVRLPDYGLGAGYCAMYVRLLAKEMFGLDYVPANAWDRKYHDKVVSEVNSNLELALELESGKVSPGMIVGVHYPKSSWNDKLDKIGERIEYTHALMYLGKINGEHLFAEQFHSNVQVRSLGDFSRDGLIARIITSPRDD